MVRAFHLARDLKKEKKWNGNRILGLIITIIDFVYLKVTTTLGIWLDNEMIIPTADATRYGTRNIQSSSQYPLFAVESPVTQVQFSKVGSYYCIKNQE